MNNPSPLVPQGATPPRAKNSLYFKILMVLSVHVVVIGGMLLQGCRETTPKNEAKTEGASTTPGDSGQTASTTGNTTPAPTGPTPAVPNVVDPNMSNAVVGGATPPLVPPTPVVVGSANPLPKAASADLNPTPGEAKEYVIAKGDTLGSIARKHGISLKTLAEANPGVDAKKLQIGHKVLIPASMAVAAAAPGAPGATIVDAGDGSVYVVKTGDILLKIAKSHGTTVKKLMAMNDLKSTSIRAGQKLKVPAAVHHDVSEPSVTPVSTTPVSTTTAPVRVSSAAPVTSSPVAAN